jgi:hypothetical protein
MGLSGALLGLIAILVLAGTVWWLSTGGGRGVTRQPTATYRMQAAAPPAEATSMLAPTELAMIASPPPATAEPTRLPALAAPLLPTATAILVAASPTASGPVATPTAVQIAAAPTSVMPAAPSPQITNFIFCDRLCSDPNARQLSSFPEGVKEIYFAYQYSGMQTGMAYTRFWTNQGDEWVRYNCIWNGPPSGTFYGKLWDSDGLRSGDWVITFISEGLDKVQASIKVKGSYQFWQPAGLLPCKDW